MIFAVDRQRRVLIAIGALALLLAIYRASTQSITLDESDTYFWFASRPLKEVFRPFPNNHILNSLLIWISTRLFGLSPLTLRLPALLGGALYLCVSGFLCLNLTHRAILQCSVFICLVFNPFVLDFMSAARGYSLANAFLLAAIAIPASRSLPVRKACVLASLALGLSFAANFSFAFVDSAVFLILAIWAIRSRGSDSAAAILASLIFPGLLAALSIGAYPISHWPKGELWFGAHSLKEMGQSLLDVSFSTPIILPDLAHLMPYVAALLGILCLSKIAAIQIDDSAHDGDRGPWLEKLILVTAAIISLTLLLHWLAFRFRHLPLPVTRTAIFFLPFCTLFAAAITAAPSRSRVSRLLSASTGALLCVLAGYFLLCLRVSYFKEYQFDADEKDVYAVLAKLNHSYDTTDAVAAGLYVSALNFYRIVSKNETFPDFRYFPDHNLPQNKSIYVLHGAYFHDFIEKHHLSIIYRGKWSEVVIAINPSGQIPMKMLDP